MRAATATILTFPGRRSTAGELGHEHRAGTGSPVPAGRCPVLLRRLARTGWAPNLVAAAPFFLSPRAGGPHDLAGALIAVLVFVLAQELAPRLLASDLAKSRESALPAAALLVEARSRRAGIRRPASPVYLRAGESAEAGVTPHGPGRAAAQLTAAWQSVVRRLNEGGGDL